MATVTGKQLAEEAIAELNGPTIYYNEAKRAALGGSSFAPVADCQAFMERIARNCGASMSYSGSNDMIRNACTKVTTLSEARKTGLLQPGVALFILKQDGNEPAKYRGDGVGNASHVGMYIGEKAFYDTENKRWCNVAHSSSSRGKVCGSTTENAWTHVGLWKCATFDNVSEQSSGGVSQMVNATVIASSGSTVNLRKAMDVNSDRVAKVPVGASIQVEATSSEWYKVVYGAYEGYMKREFISVGSTSAETTATSASIIVPLDVVTSLVTQMNTLIALLNPYISM